MSVNRSAAVTPLLFRTAARSARSQRHPFPTRLQAIAILVPRRAQSTDTSSSSSTGGNFPPPGFNTDQAKKTPQEIERKQQQSAEAYDAAGAGQQVEKSGSNKELSTSTNQADADESKSLKKLAAENAVGDKAADKKLEAKKKDEKKLTLWQKVKREAAHYWDGTKLLVTEVKISSKLALKMAAGYELTRRENRQVSFNGDTYCGGNANKSYSCNEQFRIWVALCLSPSSSSFRLLNFCSRWLSSYSPTYFPALTRDKSPRMLKPPRFVPPERTSARSCAIL